MKDFFEITKRENVIFESQEVEGLSNEEIKFNEEVYIKLQEYLKTHDIKDIDEGILGSIVGGAVGFLAGPALGKTIANALGIEKGILYDMFTSRLVTTALGAALGKGRK